MPVTHLEVAVDTIFFSSVEHDKMVNLCSIIGVFEIVCWLMVVNTRRSSLIGINLSKYRVHRIAEIMGCSVESLPMKYLGLPLGADLEIRSFGLCCWKRLEGGLMFGRKL